MKHRNSQKRIYGEYIYFITCNVDNRNEIFKEKIFCEFWIEELRLCRELKKFQLLAFCLNYDHFHFLIKPENNIANYSQIMHFLKRNYSQNINKILGYTQFKTKKFEGNEGIEGIEGDEALRRFQQPMERRFQQSVEGRFQQSVGRRFQQPVERRFQQPMERRFQHSEQHLIHEFDKIIKKYRNRYLVTFGDKYHLKFQWQTSFQDHIIRNEIDYEFHWKYTMYNFSKHGLPDNWKFSGIKFPNMIDELI